MLTARQTGQRPFPLGLSPTILAAQSAHATTWPQPEKAVQGFWSSQHTTQVASIGPAPAPPWTATRKRDMRSVVRAAASSRSRRRAAAVRSASSSEATRLTSSRVVPDPPRAPCRRACRLPVRPVRLDLRRRPIRPDTHGQHIPSDTEQPETEQVTD